MDRDYWIKKLEEAKIELGFSDGYKFVYGPWTTLDKAEVAILSLNPGRAPDGADMCTISDERGNPYAVEREETKSPLTEQFLRLAQLLRMQPTEILTGVVAPFRSDSWSDLDRRGRRRYVVSKY